MQGCMDGELNSLPIANSGLIVAKFKDRARASSLPTANLVTLTPMHNLCTHSRCGINP